MSTITCDAGVATTARPIAPVRQGEGLLARIFARVMEARLLQAMDELRRHGLRLPRELEDAGLKINERNEDSLPFVR